MDQDFSSFSSKNGNLTWEIDTLDKEIIKRRKGEFPTWQPQKKKKKIVQSSLSKEKQNSGSQLRDSEKLEFEIVSSTLLNTVDKKLEVREDNSDSDSDYELMKNKAHFGEKEKGLQAKSKVDLPSKTVDGVTREHVTGEPQISDFSSGKKFKKKSTGNVDSVKKDTGNILGASSWRNDQAGLANGNSSDNESVSSADTDDIITKCRNRKHQQKSDSFSVSINTRISEFYSGAGDYNDTVSDDDGEDEEDDDYDDDILDNTESLKELARKIESEYRLQSCKNESNSSKIEKRKEEGKSKSQKVSKNKAIVACDSVEEKVKIFREGKSTASSNESVSTQELVKTESQNVLKRTKTSDTGEKGIKKFKGTKSIFSVEERVLEEKLDLLDRSSKEWHLRQKICQELLIRQ